MLFLLHGPDTYRSLRRLAVLEEGFRKKYDKQGLNIARLDGEKLPFADLRRELMTMGFLSTKRMIVLRRFLAAKRDAKGDAELWGALEPFVKNPDVIVLFWEEELKAGAAGSLLRKLQAAVTVEAFLVLDGAKLQSWLHKEVRERGGTMRPEAATLLLATVGNDLWQLSGEVAKLVSHAGRQPITEDDVRLFVRGHFTADLFRLTDLIADRKAVQAAALLDEHLANGEPPLYLLTMVVRQIRILLQVRSLPAGLPPTEIAKQLHLHPFVARKAAAAAHRFSFAELQELFVKLVRLDRKLKTSTGDPRLLFSRLLAGMTPL